jgi:NAD(P)-dependent dehydrogenase (short-subunit alcohol dehydrogenase family)
VDNYAYSASKAAVHHMTRVLAVKLGPRGVAVNAVAPGFFPTRMTEWLLDDFEQQIVAGCPLQRKGVPADMAGVAIYLASRAGAYVNAPSSQWMAAPVSSNRTTNQRGELWTV